MPDPNLELLEAAARLLEPMLDEVVFVGYFVATKLEAFQGRGNGDYLASHDLEDVMTVVNGREELGTELRDAPEDVRVYIRDSFANLLRNAGFINALPGFLPEDAARLAVLRERLDAAASGA